MSDQRSIQARRHGDVRIFDVAGDRYVIIPRINEPEAYWREKLTPSQFKIAFEQGTERPFKNEYWNNKEAGLYRCVACNSDLFSSETKYDSGTGWPSFNNPVAEENLEYDIDNGFFIRRLEVHCARCGSHLGHVFNDGPPPSHKRFCINSASLQFFPQRDIK